MPQNLPKILELSLERQRPSFLNPAFFLGYESGQQDGYEFFLAGIRGREAGLRKPMNDGNPKET